MIWNQWSDWWWGFFFPPFKWFNFVKQTEQGQRSSQHPSLSFPVLSACFMIGTRCPQLNFLFFKKKKKTPPPIFYFYQHIDVYLLKIKKRHSCTGKSALLLCIPQEQKWTHHGNTFVYRYLEYLIIVIKKGETTNGVCFLSGSSWNEKGTDLGK